MVNVEESKKISEGITLWERLQDCWRLLRAPHYLFGYLREERGGDVGVGVSTKARPRQALVIGRILSDHLRDIVPASVLAEYDKIAGEITEDFHEQT